MQKKIYIKDMSIEDITKRLSEGQKLYTDEVNRAAYIQMYNGILVEIDTAGRIYIIGLTYLGKESNKYFLEEVEEPEADNTCIGKLCWFWNNGDNKKDFGVLHDIKMSETYIYTYIDTKLNSYERCRPISREEVEKFIKE